MHRTQISCISQGGGVHLEINSPTPGGHYMGANAPQWKHNTTQLCAKYTGGGDLGGGVGNLEINE